MQHDDALPEGVRLYRARLDAVQQSALLADLRIAILAAPLYTATMPRTGRPMSVRMTNLGALGWYTDREGGYRYVDRHPETGKAWPAMPAILVQLWADLTGYPVPPEACLVNYYARGTRMGSHRDSDEEDFAAPVLSVSLGDDAVFHVGGLKRADPKLRVTLRSGDVLVLGGPSRLAFHGIDRVLAGASTLLAEQGRFNLTLRRVTKPAASSLAPAT